MPPAALAEKLKGARPPLVLSGSGAALLAALLTDQEPVVAGTAESPDIASVAKLGLRASPGGKPVPLYLRGADAKPQLGTAVARA
jgi:hypothetical protein